MIDPDRRRLGLQGLYVLTDARLGHGAVLLEAVAAAIAGGARLVQYRDKSDDPGRRRKEAGDLADLCRSQGVTFLINDDLALVEYSGADGVHLGRDDLPVAEARARLGPRAVIGASCYGDLALAREACGAGADYVAFGAFHPSAVKPDAGRADPRLLSRARAEIPHPIAAIGGITPENGAALIEAGADMLAVITGVFGAADPRAAASRYARLFNEGSREG